MGADANDELFFTAVVSTRAIGLIGGVGRDVVCVPSQYAPRTRAPNRMSVDRRIPICGAHIPRKDRDMCRRDAMIRSRLNNGHHG